MSEKVRENLYRRRATRLGLMLHKSRGKLWSINNQLGYMIELIDNNSVIQGERFNLSLDNVGEYLDWYENHLRYSEGKIK